MKPHPTRRGPGASASRATREDIMIRKGMVILSTCTVTCIVGSRS
jgi:hypothetical protein